MPGDVLVRATTDKNAVAGAFGRAASSYDAAARLQRTVAAELLSCWQGLRDPGLSGVSLLDIGCGTGELLRLFQRDSAVSGAFGLDIAGGMLDYCRKSPDLAHVGLVQGDAEHWLFGAEVFDLVVSNFALQWCDHPDKVFAGVVRSLVPGGLCLVAMPVAGTLQELSDSWKVADPGGEHVSRFRTPEEIETLALGVGLLPEKRALLTQTALYPDVGTLARELKALGAHSGATNRARHLTGRRTYAAMLSHYEQYRRPDGKLPATWRELLVGFRKRRA